MPQSSFDSIYYIPAPKTKRKWRVTKKNTNPFAPVQGIQDVQKMIAYPSTQTLQKRLKECYSRLNKQKMAVTKTEHRSPRGTRRRSVRRSVRRSPRRRSVRRSPRRRSVRRSPRRRPMRSRRDYGRYDPVARARARAREKRRMQEGWRRRS